MDSTAKATAEEIFCSGGTFDVRWRGTITVEKTMFVVDGTHVTVFGIGSNAGVNGNNSTRIFTVVNASLHVNDVDASYGFAASGGAVALAGSTAMFNRTSFVGNSAIINGGAIHVTDGSSISFEGKTLLSQNTIAAGSGGADYLDDASVASWSGEANFTENSVVFHADPEGGGALAIVGSGSASWSGRTLFLGNRADSRGNGGAVRVAGDSDVTWSGETTFFDNIGGYSGGAGCRLFSGRPLHGAARRRSLKILRLRSTEGHYTLKNFRAFPGLA